MEQLIFTSSLGEDIIMGDTNPYILKRIQGTSRTDLQVLSQKSPYQDGETYLGNQLNMRLITIELWVTASDMDEMSRLRDNILKIFNPKLGIGTLTYQYGEIKRQINCVVKDIPEFDNSLELDTQMPVFIGLLSPDPFWVDTEETVEELAGWIGGAEFPLEFPTDFSLKASEKDIENEGSTDCPVKIEFHGPADNPEVVNYTTGETIKLNRNLLTGEILTIQTDFGNKKVEITKTDGTVENAFHYIDLSSSFWNLQIGTNRIGYETTTQDPNTKVIIYRRNRYIGI